MRYLDPKNDLTFKKVFGEHPNLLRSFLNALLPLAPDAPIVSLEYLPAELVPEVPLLKYSIVDVRCIDSLGRQFIVEMQMLWTNSFKSRVLFNASKAYVRQLDKGRYYDVLQPVYALSLLNENFEPDTTGYYHHYSIVHTQHPDRKLDGLEFVFIELPKFRAQNLTDRRMMVLWLRYLTEIEDGSDTAPADLLANRDLREAVDVLQESAFTKGEMYAYDRYWDSISSERTLVKEKVEQAVKKAVAQATAEATARGMEQGIEKGIEQGIEKGIEQGIEQGIEKGIEQGQQTEREAVVLNAHRAGLSAETIAQITNLSVAALSDILRKLL
jgi:predicted transposase/invertase (TIGR01784 family)